MSRGTARAGRRVGMLPGLAVLLGGAGLLVLACGRGSAGEPRAVAPAPPPATPVADRAPADPSASRPRRARPAPRRPVRVAIPSIGVDAPVVPLGLDPRGALEAPARFDVAGWWSGGARPGEPGPAVLAGHVDSRTGPAVFFRVRSLARGARIVVTDRAGRRRRFVVDRVDAFPKTAFPTARVYGATARPALRLITCSGTFDRSTGHYLDNTVVFAHA